MKLQLHAHAYLHKFASSCSCTTVTKSTSTALKPKAVRCTRGGILLSSAVQLLRSNGIGALWWTEDQCISFTRTFAIGFGWSSCSTESRKARSLRDVCSGH